MDDEQIAGTLKQSSDMYVRSGGGGWVGSHGRTLLVLIFLISFLVLDKVGQIIGLRSHLSFDIKPIKIFGG